MFNNLHATKMNEIFCIYNSLVNRGALVSIQLILYFCVIFNAVVRYCFLFLSVSIFHVIDYGAFHHGKKTTSDWFGVCFQSHCVKSMANNNCYRLLDTPRFRYSIQQMDNASVIVKDWLTTPFVRSCPSIYIPWRGRNYVGWTLITTFQRTLTFIIWWILFFFRLHKKIYLLRPSLKSLTYFLSLFLFEC